MLRIVVDTRGERMASENGYSLIELLNVEI